MLAVFHSLATLMKKLAGDACSRALRRCLSRHKRGSTKVGRLLEPQCSQVRGAANVTIVTIALPRVLLLVALALRRRSVTWRSCTVLSVTIKAVGGQVGLLEAAVVVAPLLGLLLPRNLI